MKGDNKPQRQYIYQIKMLFPVIKKSERRYLKKLHLMIDDYCEANPNISLETLYKEFGIPSDIVNEYYSDKDIHDTVKQIKHRLITKRILLCGVVVLLIVLATYCFGSWIIYKTRKDINSHDIYSSYEEYAESLEGDSDE